ncbi:MAG: hypothetical protein ACYCPT_07710, partial [Acidimicrobiales bacterium]
YANNLSSSGHPILAWTSMVLALCGAVGYWSLLCAALVRVRRYFRIEARGVMWWISAGCGGLVAASLVRANESVQ